MASELEAKNAALITLVGDMGGRHEQLTGAIRYFEDQYVQDPSKDKVELLTKECVVLPHHHHHHRRRRRRRRHHSVSVRLPPSLPTVPHLPPRYLADALNTVATDVNDIASNLNDFLDLQAEAVDSLGTSLEMANMRLRMLKQQVTCDHTLRHAARVPVLSVHTHDACTWRGRRRFEMHTTMFI